MSNIENGLCTIEEYKAFLVDRFLEGEFQEDELYMMMFALSGGRAAKKPSRVTDIRQRNSGLYLVRMTILNADLHPDCKTKSIFSDGYWQPKGSRKLKVGNLSVESAYMKSYNDEIDQGLHDLIEKGVPHMRTTTTPRSNPVYII